MEGKELVEKVIGIFKAMGEAVEKHASVNVRGLLVGNPANTNAPIMSHFAPKVPGNHIANSNVLDFVWNGAYEGSG